jgi:hypothetical protein
LQALTVLGGIFTWLRSESGNLPFVGTATTTVTGEFVLTDSNTARSSCIGHGGYSDIGPGTQVILTNQDGKILGSSEFSTGTADTHGYTCTYSFTIPDVPTDQNQYSIEISHRGKVVNSQSRLSTNGWKFALSMGD